MASETYFVRSKGRISGPFDISALQKLVRRRLLSRFDEISPDRAAWSAAGEFEDLFGSAAAVAVEEPPGAATGDSFAAHTAAPGTEPAFEKFFYSQAGGTVGPVPLNVLRALAENGTLRREDVVWQEQSQVAAPAYQIPALAAVFSGERGASRSSVIDRVTSAAAIEAQRQSSTAAIVVGITAASIILIATLPPVLRVNGATYWWFQALGQRGSTLAGIIFIFNLLAALALFILSPLAAGLGRAVPFICIGAASTLLWLSNAISSEVSGSASVGSGLFLLLPAIGSLLLTVCRFRASGVTAEGGRIVQGVLGGLLAIVGLTLLIIFLIELSRGLEWAPGWVVAVITLASIGGVSALASGILSLIAAAARKWRGANLAAAICSGIAVLMIICAAATAVAGIDLYALVRALSPEGSSRLPSRGWITFLFVRVLVIFYAYVALMSAGLRELLVTLNMPVEARPGGTGR